MAMLTRRSLCALPFSVAACASAGGDGAESFVFENGIGSRAGGPSLFRYQSIDGKFGRATRATWWQTP